MIILEQTYIFSLKVTIWYPTFFYISHKIIHENRGALTEIQDFSLFCDNFEFFCANLTFFSQTFLILLGYLFLFEFSWLQITLYLRNQLRGASDGFNSHRILVSSVLPRYLSYVHTGACKNVLLNDRVTNLQSPKNFLNNS